VIALQDYLINEKSELLSDFEKEELQSILNELADSTTISALG